MGKKKKRRKGIDGRKASEWSWNMTCTTQPGGTSKVERPIILEYKLTRLKPPNIPMLLPTSPKSHNLFTPERLDAKT